jgi:hypothetical protein
MAITLKPSAGPPPDGTDIVVEDAVGQVERDGRILSLSCKNLGSTGQYAAVLGAIVWIHHDGRWEQAVVDATCFPGGNLDADFRYPPDWGLPDTVVIGPREHPDRLWLPMAPTRQPTQPLRTSTSSTDLTLVGPTTT